MQGSFLKVWPIVTPRYLVEPSIATTACNGKLFCPRLMAHLLKKEAAFENVEKYFQELAI